MLGRQLFSAVCRFSVPVSQSLYVLASTLGVLLWCMLLRFSVPLAMLLVLAGMRKLDCRLGRCS